MIDLFILGLAVAATSMTISKTHIFEQSRNQVAKFGPWPDKLIRCPWCLSHWIAGLGVPLWLELNGIMQWFVYTMATVAISGVTSAIRVI
jgi:hypothetical protein